MSEEVERKHTRFTPDPNTVSWYCHGHEDFKEDHVALPFSEAHGGVGLVVVHKTDLKEGDNLLVKTGEIGPLKSEVRWIKSLEHGVQLIGIQYLE